MAKRYIGIDLGGTSMKLGIVDEKGQLLYKMEEPTLTDEKAESGISRMAKSIRRLADETDTPWEEVGGLGLGLPGFLDIPGGKILRLTNIPWENVSIKEILEEELRVPVAIDNDANVAAMGEAWSGAGASFSDLICVTLGTGVGGGIIVGGQLVHGVSGLAGEIGHIQVVEDGSLCGCGQYGCVETISSATGMVRLVKEAISEGRQTSLAAKKEKLTARDIFEAAKEHDAVAIHVIDEATVALARVLAILSVVNNPEAFIIGGGVSQAGELLFRPLTEAYTRRCLSHASAGVQILPAQLGNDAGIIGAAGLTAKQKMNRRMA
ncbi:ROK family glucokinase [Salinithrix halophila]|uniref:Glucokinase n=1 Tax=Salinithrix halophila TaxID=1485204 RepID=A0ABV8JEZ7_9BACL